MRRLLHWSFACLCHGLCLLSLLACLGTAWLWWRGTRRKAFPVNPDPWVEVAMPGFFAEARVGGTLYVRAVGRWPGGAGAWAGERWDSPDVQFGLEQGARGSHVGSVRYESGVVRVYLRPDTKPERLSFSDWIFSDDQHALGASEPRWSPALPYWEASGVPTRLAVTAFPLPPLLWFARRSRRLYVRRRRCRLGLCQRCGYDLRGNTSGRCSECGAVRAGKAGT